MANSPRAKDWDLLINSRVARAKFSSRPTWQAGSFFHFVQRKTAPNISLFILSGLDVPSVDVVINFDAPTHSKDYIHRVGRTARAGRSGKSILIVSQYDVEMMLRLEQTLDQKLELYATDEELCLLKERVDEAGRHTASQLRDEQVKLKLKSSRKRRPIVEEADEKDRDDDVVEAGMPKHSLEKKRRT